MRSRCVRAVHWMILSLGSNVEAERHLPWVEAELERLLVLCGRTRLMQTAPIDFPYPSADFANRLLWAQTDRPLDEILAWLKSLEICCGRTVESRRTRPEYIPMDLDLIAWDGRIYKPRDLSRPYVQQGLVELGCMLDEQAQRLLPPSQLSSVLSN